MSKAMEALERLRPDGDCACIVCEELAGDFALLCDYITATEAALRVAIEGLEQARKDFEELGKATADSFDFDGLQHWGRLAWMQVEKARATVLKAIPEDAQVEKAIDEQKN